MNSTPNKMQTNGYRETTRTHAIEHRGCLAMHGKAGRRLLRWTEATLTFSAATCILHDMSITATVKNGSIALPPGLDVPDGTQARIVFEPAADQTLAQRYAALIGFTDQLPEDLAENHDHYLHGGGKKR